MKTLFLRLILCVGTPVIAASPSEPPGVLLEAENFQRRVPADGSFAVVAKQPGARGGAVLSRFFGQGGRVSYNWTAPHEGTWHLWIRYAANQDQTIQYAVDAADESDRSRAGKAALPGTGDLSGWRWARLGSARLRSGAHTLTLYSAPVRLDSIWIDSVDRPPAELPPAGFTLEQTREHLRNPIEPITPAWLAEADAYELPAWFDDIRVCAHTRLSWAMRTRLPDTFAHAGRLFASIGFKEMSRHIKGGSEPAWWPSSVGAVQTEARTRNFAKEIIDEAHANGCRIIVYSRHMEDAHLAGAHPEWRAYDEKGPKSSRRGEQMCLNSPYADFMETRLMELARLGADGFFFDEVHLPKPVCYCQNCRAGFEQATGLKYPTADVPADPLFQKAIEYRNTRLEHVFRRWRAAIHGVNPECVLLIGSNTYPAMHDRHTTHRLWRVADVMKSEFNLAARVGQNRVFTADKSLAPPEVDARIALGYTLDRDACDGRPPHVWAHGIPDATQMMFATAGMIAHGQVANLDHDEATIPDPKRFGPAVALANRVAPGFAGARPLRWAAVHFSEYARDHYAPDESAMWKRVLYPVYGAFTTLLRRHLPVGIVTDSQLEQGRLDGYRILFLPAPQHLTPAMRAAIEGFRVRGGLVIEQQPTWAWHRPGDGMSQSGAALLAALGSARTSAPVEASGGTEKMHLVPFLSRDRKRVTIALANDFSWVRTGRPEDGGAKAPKSAKAAKAEKTRPSPKDERTAKRGQAGKAAPADRPASAEGEDEPTIAGGVSAPPLPCRNVRVVLRLGSAPLRVQELVTGRALEFRQTADGFAVDVPDFECMSVLVVELPRAL